MAINMKEPLQYSSREFPGKLVEWIGDILYDELPEFGYEVRDEQIFTAFQVADAVAQKKIHLAEAGLGTGKTFAYLLSAIPYARFTRKPMVIACATSALQEQLADAKGDIHTLSNLLGLEVDARMAKHPGQYLCDVKLEANLEDIDEEAAADITAWLGKTTWGERAEFPALSDHVWRQIAWDEMMNCDTCIRRGYCKMVRARENYRQAKDLIIVDHDTFFADLWSREERIDSGRMPILPDYAGVIFDEGHKVVLPALMQAGKSLNKEELMHIIFAMEQVEGLREEFLSATCAVEDTAELFFELLEASVVPQENTARYAVVLNENLLGAAAQLKQALDTLLMELQIEQELYVEDLPQSVIDVYEATIERAMIILTWLVTPKRKERIVWMDKESENLWVVPKHLPQLLKKNLFKKQLPVVFTSATLSNEGDFDYFIRTLGLENVTKSTIGSPFDIANQVKVYLSQKDQEEALAKRLENLKNVLISNGGSTLVLTNSLKEVRHIRKGLEMINFPFEILWEDQADRGYLMRQFKEDKTAVLVGSTFWEGVDIPGESLTQVVIWDLPFPALDPLVEEERREAVEDGLEPTEAVDYPLMGLKLKQGCGRLIRKEDDEGRIIILEGIVGTPWEHIVRGAVPAEAKVGYIEEM